MTHLDFNTIYPETEPSHLLETVLAGVHKNIERTRKIKFALLSTTTLLSLGASFPAFSYLMHSFTQSGFYQYLQLSLSDGTVLLSYWKDFGATLVESLPLTSLIAFLSIILVFTWSLTNTIKNSKQIFLRA